MRFIIFLLVAAPLACIAQCKTFIIGAKGDTLNCTDNNDLKQGRWVMHVEPLRGEPGYEQEGFYKDGKKDGVWRSYNLMGDLMSAENYKWGYKNGTSYYYNIYGLEREESWKAIDPKNPYDTVDVPDLHSDVVYKRIVKVDASTVKHGTWRYFDPQTGALVKTEDYVLDKLTDPKKKNLALNKTDSTRLKSDTAALTKTKPPEVLEYEKKNSNKKKIKVRDGATGVQ